MLEVRALTKTFGDVSAVRDVSFVAWSTAGARARLAAAARCG